MSMRQVAMLHDPMLRANPTWMKSMQSWTRLWKRWALNNSYKPFHLFYLVRQHQSKIFTEPAILYSIIEMLINIQLFTHDMNYTLSQRAVAYAVALAMMAGCAGLPKDAETRKLSERTDSIENRVDVFNDTGDSAFAAGNLKEAVRQYTRAFELLNPNDARKLPENAFLQEQYIRSVSALPNTH